MSEDKDVTKYKSVILVYVICILRQIPVYLCPFRADALSAPAGVTAPTVGAVRTDVRRSAPARR